MIGIGDINARRIVLIGNRPDLPFFRSLTTVQPLLPGDVKKISDATGNHWRKVFNVFAKIIYALEPNAYCSWQHYRDECLLQTGSSVSLVFADAQDSIENKTTTVLVTGKAFAESLGVLGKDDPLEDGIYVDYSRRLIVTPYFDYRQLSNLKIEQLVGKINALEAE